MKSLFILNDAPYGSERSYNGLRLAGALSKAEGEEVRMFLMGDAASCAKGGQKVPEGNGTYLAFAGCPCLRILALAALRRTVSSG